MLQPFSKALPALAGMIAIVLGLALLPAGLCAERAKAADPAVALIEALRAQNTAHLRLPVWPRSESSLASLQTGEWGHGKSGPWRMGVGPVQVEITARKVGRGNDTRLTPILTLTVNGKRVTVLEGDESFSDQPYFAAQIVEMDKSNPYPEILFSTYTGGAHCCSNTRILTSSSDGKSWSVIEAGLYDGGPLTAQDADFDGRSELIERDNRFLYAFGCYACSRAPLKIERLEKGKLIDVSRHAAFRDRQRQWLKTMIEAAEGDMDINAFLAGYAAQKIVVGESRQGLALMREFYDRTAGDDYERCSVPLDKQGNCKGKMQKLDFPDALEHFLKNSGYNWGE